MLEKLMLPRSKDFQLKLDAMMRFGHLEIVRQLQD